MKKMKLSGYKVLLISFFVSFLFAILSISDAPNIDLSKKKVEKKEVVLCVSVMGRYFNSMLSKASSVPRDKLFAARAGHYNILSPSSLDISTKYPMRIYTEDSYDRSKGRPLVDSRKVIQNAEYIDIFQRFRWLESYVEDPDNSIRRFYRNLRKHDKGSKDASETDLGLLRKILAILDTLNAVTEGTVVLWLDMDTYFMKELSNEVIHYLKKADVTYIPSFTFPDKCKYEFPFENNQTMKYSCGICADTGILAYVAQDKTRKVLQEQIDWVLRDALAFQHGCFREDKKREECNAGLYKKGSICSHTSSLNDIAVFGRSMMNNLKSLKQQFFSTGCLKHEDGNWVEFAKYYKVGKTMLCGSEHENIKTSEFNILEYIMHFRGTSTGLAKRRSLWNSHEPAPKKSFMASMKEKGGKGQKIQVIQ